MGPGAKMRLPLYTSCSYIMHSIHTMLGLEYIVHFSIDSSLEVVISQFLYRAVIVTEKLQFDVTAPANTQQAM